MRSFTSTSTPLMLLLLFFALLDCAAASPRPALSNRAAAALLPAAGQYKVKYTRNIKLVDRARRETFAPNGTEAGPRKLMVSSFQPLKSGRCQNVEYMPPALAAAYDRIWGEKFNIPNGTYESVTLESCEGTPLANAPLLIFSPGLGLSRFQNSALVRKVAAAGYAVVSIDHTYDADAVQFYDDKGKLGKIVYETQDNLDTITNPFELLARANELIAVRQADVAFVLDRVAMRAVAGLDASVACGTNQVGVWGHSLGGATAVSVLTNDSRVAGALNLDGAFAGPPLTTDISQPVLLVGAEGHNQSSDVTWALVWPHLKGYAVELAVKGLYHYSFTDTPLMGAVLKAKYPQLLGRPAADGRRAFELVSAYTVAFFDFLLKNKGQGVLAGPGATPYGEVVYVDRTAAAA